MQEHFKISHYILCTFIVLKQDWKGFGGTITISNIYSQNTPTLF